MSGKLTPFDPPENENFVCKCGSPSFKIIYSLDKLGRDDIEMILARCERCKKMYMVAKQGAGVNVTAEPDVTKMHEEAHERLKEIIGENNRSNSGQILDIVKEIYLLLKLNL